ncbi:MAG: 3-hydroxybutyryl-CoA dehydrogenase [Solirubrobacterales bacterium]
MSETSGGSTATEIRTVAVVGGGFMGSGITESSAVAGVPVTVFEADPERRPGVTDRIAKSLGRAVKGGKMDQEAMDAAIGRIVVANDISEIKDADLVIEVVPEDLDLKLQVMRAIEGEVRDDAIVASNTSSIPIAELAGSFKHPERVCGLHFFAPVPVMKLVEIVVALDSSESTIQTARDFCKTIGKRPIETKDRSGFVVNMLLVPYLMAGVRMYEEEFATPEDIDEGMRLGCGHPMGPLELCDFIGLDVLYSVCDSLYEEFKRNEYAPPPILKRMVASGRFGRKSGRGFYTYENGAKV